MTHHLFVLSKELFKAISFEEVKATTQAMAEAGVFKPPFKNFDISINASAAEVQKFILPSWSSSPEDSYDELFPLILRYETEDDGYYSSVCSRLDKSRSFLTLEQVVKKAEKLDGAEYAIEIHRNLQDTTAYLYSTLIVLLATKNIAKQTNENKFRKLVSGSRKRSSNYKYSSITTLNIGKITDTFNEGESRGPVRPHLRRGHLRNQRIGEGRKDVKQIFIQPVFVNADDGWIENQRKEYRVKL